MIGEDGDLLDELSDQSFIKFPRTNGSIRRILDINLEQSSHVESCVLLEQVSNRKPDAKIRIDVNLEDYYRIKDKKQRTE